MSPQEHAIVERMQETLLTDPFFLFYQLGVHDRDLAGGSAEADKS